MDRGRCDLEHRGRSDEMAHFVGLDVSVKETSVCVVDDAGKGILEQKIIPEPADIIALLASLGVSFGRIGIEAGPLSQWLVNALTAANLPVICVETRHMKALLTAQQISKTDRNGGAPPSVSRPGAAVRPTMSAGWGAPREGAKEVRTGGPPRGDTVCRDAPSKPL